MNKKDIPKIKRRFDRLVSQIILTRADRTCDMCGRKEGRMNASHGVPRQVLSVRWNLKNLTCLCYRCHLWVWHKDPITAYEWFKTKYGLDRINYLKKESNKPFNLDENQVKVIEVELRTQWNLLNIFNQIESE